MGRRIDSEVVGMVALAMNLKEARDFLVREFFSLTDRLFQLFPDCVFASFGACGCCTSNHLQVYLMVDGLCFDYK